jgi:hypothetical protein
VYQLRVVLRAVSPLIWHRLLVRSDTTIVDMHGTLQTAFGWTDEHLNRFVVHGREYGVSHDGGIGFGDDPRHVRLADLGLRARERFLYEYDFTDGWQHDVRVERILPLDLRRRYPECIGGRRAVPPEDCGGPWAFLELRQRYSIISIAEPEISSGSWSNDAWSSGPRHSSTTTAKTSYNCCAGWRSIASIGEPSTCAWLNTLPRQSGGAGDEDARAGRHRLG